MCRHLEAVTRGEITRLLINIPPGCTKSMLVNVMWPAWEWGPKGLDWLKYISTSHEKGLAIEHMSKCRELIKSEWYQSHWPLEFKSDADGKEYYATTKQGMRFAGSTTSKLTGRRGQRFIIDDPHSVASAESDAERTTTAFWFTETVPTRFTDQKKPVMVVIMQRLHTMDVAGVIIQQLAEAQGWVHLCLPMEFEKKHRSYSKVPSPFGKPKKMRRVLEDGEPLPYYVPDKNGEMLYPQDPRTKEGELLWEERFDRQSIEDLKLSFRAKGGSYAEASQLQQRPVPRGGGMFQRKDFRIIDKVPDNVVRWAWGVDLAATDSTEAAFTVLVKMGITADEQLVIGDIVRFRGTPYEVETTIKNTCERDRNVPISIPQDPGQAGKAQKAGYAKLLHGFDFHFSPESGSKENRARPLAAQSEAGNIALVRAPWNDPFLAEAALFPHSEFLDQIDAASRAYSFLLMRQEPEIAIAPAKEFN